MRNLVISYSFTGNNLKLGKEISKKTNADFIELKERNRRRVYSIFIDILFNRTPKTHKITAIISQYKHIIIVAPIWLGKIATPLRSFLFEYKTQIHSYSFVSISGNLDKKKPNIKNELTKRLGKPPKFIVNAFIKEMVSPTKKLSFKDIQEYKLTKEDASKIILQIEQELNKL